MFLSFFLSFLILKKIFLSSFCCPVVSRFIAYMRMINCTERCSGGTLGVSSFKNERRDVLQSEAVLLWWKTAELSSQRKDPRWPEGNRQMLTGGASVTIKHGFLADRTLIKSSLRWFSPSQGVGGTQLVKGQR